MTMALGIPIATVAGGAPPSAVASSAPIVAINELNYHPADDDPASEFIELVNTTGRAIDIGGWCIDGVGDYCFAPGTTIAARAAWEARLRTSSISTASLPPRSGTWWTALGSRGCCQKLMVARVISLKSRVRRIWGLKL